MKTKIYIIFALSLSFLILLAYMYKTDKRYKSDIQQFEQFRDDASKLISLKNKWSNKSSDKKLIKRIQTRFKPTKFKLKGNIYTLDFEGITKTDLNRLGKMLLNSNLIIKKIDLRREDEKISLHVEVKIWKK